MADASTTDQALRRKSLRSEARLVEPDIDASGVDRAQTRAMLALAPEGRLRRVEELVESALEIRELNGLGPGSLRSFGSWRPATWSSSTSA